MDLHLACARTVAAELAGRHVDETDVLALHKALAAESRRAEDKILADADGKIASIAVGVSLVVDAPAHFADLVLDLVDRGGVEEFVEFLAGLGLWAVLPVVGTFDKRGIDV